MSPARRPASELDAGLPAASETEAEAAQAEVRAGLVQQGARLLVVDDDPTGSQTVADVPLLLRFEADDLHWAFAGGTSVAFALTNSRALAEPEAVALNEFLGAHAENLTREVGLDLRVLSRSDSTLRGHFPAEVHALDSGMSRAGAPRLDATLLCPAFVEIGRVTVDDVHWVAQDGIAVPAAETEFARDPVFGYTSSNLREWAVERSHGRISNEDVSSISLADIRRGGVTQVEALLEATDASIVILNAVVRADLDILAQAITRTEARGKRFIYRTGPSFVAARAGLPTPAPITPEEPTPAGLTVIGSHTHLTNRQLDVAVRTRRPRVVELQISEVLASAPRRAAAIRQAVIEATSAPDEVILVTSRVVAPAVTSAEMIEVKTTIATAVAHAVREIVARRLPGFVLAKGGVTSHDLARRALGAGRATVLGQLFPGQVSLWRLEDSDLAPGIPYVVFPGNVGGDEALAQALALLTGTAE